MAGCAAQGGCDSVRHPSGIAEVRIDLDAHGALSGHRHVVAAAAVLGERVGEVVLAPVARLERRVHAARHCIPRRLGGTAVLGRSARSGAP